MLITLAIILIVLWLLAFLFSYTLGGFIYLLPALAIIFIIVRLIKGGAESLD